MELYRLERLSFTYPDGTKVLKEINLTIRKGDVVAVLGANGCGKTTLLKQLNGLLRPTAGEVRLEGRRVEEYPEREIFSTTGFVFQDPNDQVFSLTVEEDVAYGPRNLGLPEDTVERRVSRALERVEMTAHRGRPVAALSHGQRQRVGIAGVLAMEPKVLILDEPTSGLDPMGVRSIMTLLQRLNRETGLTLIVATHAVDLVPLYIGRIVIMSRGRIVREGSPSEALLSSSEMERCRLHLPHIAELMEALKEQDRFPLKKIPLTIGEARREIVKLVPSGLLGESSANLEKTAGGSL
ncbi:MAG: ATP-binding cassette domain-containing protein [Deltaproteobacteria bacterium]|nr:ATP-binding cassette domain-containing protein [Deltaproteobacteria bacterium]